MAVPATCGGESSSIFYQLPSPSGRDALHASQRWRAQVNLKRDQVKETHAIVSTRCRALVDIKRVGKEPPAMSLRIPSSFPRSGDLSPL